MVKLNADPSYSLGSIIEDFLDEYNRSPSKERMWNYYFIKYSNFRRHQDGFYYWPDEKKLYECMMLNRKTTGGFHWDPFLFSIKCQKNKSLILENYGAPLIYIKDEGIIKITTKNDCYKIEAIDDEGMILLNKALDKKLISTDFTLKINQSKDGLDIEDRVEKGVKLIDELNKL